MSTRNRFEKQIIRKSGKSNTKGYVLNNIDNLEADVTLDLFYDDLMQGSGNELVSKFNALYSSSALVVNNFSVVKKRISDFKFLDNSGFDKASFERQFKTGLPGTPPNLDFVIENSKSLIAFESKYLEPLVSKKVVFKDSYNKQNLKYLNDFWFDLINHYKNRELYLDVAQLIKHSIGLINYNRLESVDRSISVILVYIYWQPINFEDFDECLKHRKELEDFRLMISNQVDVRFVSLSYDEFWDMYTDFPFFSEHFNRMKKRYCIEI
jgi:hypothetical protein